MEGFLQKVSTFVLIYKIPFMLGFIGVICFSYGLIALFVPKPTEEKILFTTDTPSTEAVKNADDQREIVINVAGAVNSPGVYRLPIDARVEDAITAGGGMSKEADHTGVERTMNLAAKLVDGSKVYVPRIGEGPETNTTTSDASNQGSININAASQSELESLPGIGPVTAEKIIGNRPYGKMEDLIEKNVVSNSVFEKIKGSIGVY